MTTHLSDQEATQTSQTLLSLGSQPLFEVNVVWNKISNLNKHNHNYL